MSADSEWQHWKHCYNSFILRKDLLVYCLPLIGRNNSERILQGFICKHLESGTQKRYLLWVWGRGGKGKGSLPFVIFVPLEFCWGNCWGFTLQCPFLSHGDACTLSFWNVWWICREKTSCSIWKCILKWDPLLHSLILFFILWSTSHTWADKSRYKLCCRMKTPEVVLRKNLLF